MSESAEPVAVSETLLFDDDIIDMIDNTEDFSTSLRSLRSPLLASHPSASFPSNNTIASTTTNTPLNGLNYLNVVTYMAHLFVSWGIGVWGLDGVLDTRWQILEKNETLVMVARWARYLWVPILVTEFLFATVQLVPHYRARPLVQDGTAYFFFYTFLIQTCWTIFFSMEIFIGSFISVVAALISLISLLASQHKSLLSVRNKSRFQYFVFRFPFFLHTGWMVLMTADHLAISLRHYLPTHTSLLLAADILALAALLIAATTAMTYIHPTWWPEQDFVIPCVVIWSYLGIAWRLDDPSEEIILTYGMEIIHAMQWACIFLAMVVSAILIPSVVFRTARECCTIRVVELDV